MSDRRTPHRLAALVSTTTALALVTLGAPGCSEQGAEQDISQPVMRTVEQLQSAFAASDMTAICERLTKSARRQAGSVAHGFPSVSCARDVRRALEIVEDGGGWSRSQPAISRVRAHPRGATATLTDQRLRWKADIPLVDRDGRWQLAGFFGAAPREVDALEKSFEDRPFPTPNGRRIRALAENGQPCSDLSASRYPDVAGGCSFKVSADSVPIRMLTPFGHFKFADCKISYRVSVDAAGRTWTDRWVSANTRSTAGDPTPPGCPDNKACTASSFDDHPWKGRLADDGRGGYLHHMDLCLRSCIGLFTGDFVTRLARRGGRWRVEPSDQGATGFKIDGELTVSGPPFDLRN